MTAMQNHDCSANAFVNAFFGSRSPTHALANKMTFTTIPTANLSYLLSFLFFLADKMTHYLGLNGTDNASTRI